MLRRMSTTEEESPITDASQNDDDGSPPPQDRRPDPQSSHDDDDDIETGFVRGVDPPEKDGENSQYTHVLIPRPGHNSEGIDVHDDSMACAGDEKEKKPKEEKKSVKIGIFGGSKSTKEATKDNTETAEEVKMLEEIEEPTGGRRRSCPIFCAICLMEYSPSDRISWSSNPQCTHCFHEDCVVQWLVSLGRTKSKNQRFSDDPNEEQLFNYHLECPCCRQEFISRGKAELPDVCGDERV